MKAIDLGQLLGDRPGDGGVAFIGRNSSVCAALPLQAQQGGREFRCIVDCSRHPEATVAELIAALAGDAGTRAIAVSMGQIGDGEAFIAALARAKAAGKPVVILRTGTVGDEAWQAVLREHAAIEVASHHELLGVASYLATLTPDDLPRGRRVAIVSSGGGAGVLATDECGRQGLQTPLLSPETLDRVRPLTPPIASIANPIDLTPAMHLAQWVPKYVPALEGIASDPQVDTLYVSVGVGALGPAETARSIIDFKQRSPKALVISWTNAPREGIDMLIANGLFAFNEAGDALSALRKVADYAERRNEPARPTASAPWPANVGADKAGAAALLTTLGARPAAPGGRLEPVQLRITAYRDPLFGVMVACGSGGDLDGLIDDRAIARAPFDDAGARALLRRLEILDRAKKFIAPAAIEGFTALLAQLSQIAASAPWQRFDLRLDPVAWDKDTVVVGACALSADASA